MIKKTIALLLIATTSLANVNEPKNTIKQYLYNTNLPIQYKKLLFAQTILETGNFKYIKHNNIYGIMSKIQVSNKSVTYRLKRFKSIYSCIDYRIKIFIKHHHKIRNSYASDTRYYQKLNKILNQIK